jgi:hypothetical protein
MRPPRWFWVGAALAALALGASGAESYARLAAPFYERVAQQLIRGHPWKLDGVVVAKNPRVRGAELRLTGEVFRDSERSSAAAVVVSRIQVGEVVETPIIFWTLLLLWPADSLRHRVVRVAVGLLCFPCIEALVGVPSLLSPLAQASAMLAGHAEPLTAWERWARFLESGGHFAIEAGAVALVVSAAARFPGRGVTPIDRRTAFQ